MLGTMAGGAADCLFWLSYLGKECRLHELRHKRRISVAAASKILSNIVFNYKGMGLSLGSMICGVTPQEGPALYYVDSDGSRLQGDLFCVGSGQTFAYGVLDAEYNYDLTVEEALALGTRSILAATHRVTLSLIFSFIGNFHVKLMAIRNKGRILWRIHQPLPRQGRGMGQARLHRHSRIILEEKARDWRILQRHREFLRDIKKINILLRHRD